MSPIRSWPKSAWVGMPKIVIGQRCEIPFAIAARPAAGRSWADSSLDERTLSVLQRPERLLGRNRRTDLVIVPGRLGVRGLLHLHQVRRMDLAPVHPDATLAEQGIVSGHLL